MIFLCFSKRIEKKFISEYLRGLIWHWTFRGGRIRLLLLSAPTMMTM